MNTNKNMENANKSLETLTNQMGDLIMFSKANLVKEK